MKLFTKFEDLPDNLRRPGSGVKFENGWIDQTKRADKTFMITPEKFQNVGVRAVIDYRIEENGNLGIRSVDPGKTEIQYNVKSGECMIRTMDPAKAKPGWHTASRSHVGTTANLQAVVEIGAVNGRAIARFNNQLLSIAQLDLLAKGSVYYYGYCPVRDIEVINLDGLPEAEALRILGVDEKGNDLRALAAKQEQQMAEQAKAVDALAAIPELKALHEQFVKLEGERVTAPFEAEVAKLNAGYLGGIDREIANEKKAGHLDGVIALEAEKKLIADKQPIPAEDDAATTEALKKLRGIYRAAYAKIEATRAANLKLLTDPLTIRLKQLEAELTQKDRIDHAKTVREYAQKLTESSAPASSDKSTSAVPTPSSASSLEIAPYIKLPKMAKPGRLKAVGWRKGGLPVDLSKAEGINDFVQVYSRENGRWIALRSNGEIISHEGKTASGVLSLCYGTAMISKDNRLMPSIFGWNFDFKGPLPTDNDKWLPADHSNIVMLESRRSTGIGLRADGTALVFGKSADPKSGDFRIQPLGPEVLKNISSIGVGLYSACAIRSDGQMIWWDNTGLRKTPKEAEKKVLKIIGGGLDHYFLTSSGTLYELNHVTGVAREVADRIEDIHYTGHNELGALARHRKGGWTFASSIRSTSEEHAFITGALGNLPSEHFSPLFSLRIENKEAFATAGGMKGHDCFFIWIEPADGSLVVPPFKMPKLD